MQAPAGVAVPGGGIITSQSPPFAVPIRYMILGIVCFGLFAIDLVLQSGSLAQGQPGTPAVVAVTHLLTLGALLSFVMGAVYQLTTVAFLIPISSVPAARWNFWLYVVALIGLFTAMANWWAMGFLIFGFLMVATIYIYAIVMMISLFRTKIRGPMFGFVVCAHAYLMLAVSVAVLLVLTDSGTVPVLNNWMGPLIATHILLAVGGFFTFLVMGFSLKLLPMFTLSHGFATGRQKWTLLLAHLSLWLLIAGVWTHATGLLWAGAVIGVVALSNHLLDVRGILKKRMRRKLEPPIRAVVAAVAGAIIGLLMLLVQIVAQGLQAGWQSIVIFYLFGAITLTVMGFAYKIVPFLVWSKRYSKPARTGKPILISDLIHLNQAWPVLIAFALGLLLLTGSSAAQWKPGAIGGCICIAIAILTFCIQLLRVIDPLKVGRELLDRD